MTTREFTGAIMIAAAASLIGWDIYAAFHPGATISEIMRDVSYGHPVLPFAVGVLCGHFFWFQSPPSSPA